MVKKQADLEGEQAYVDWAYERLDVMVRKADQLPEAAGDVNTHRALVRMAETRRRGLLRDLDKLVIGRLDFSGTRAQATGQPTVYVGKSSIDGDNLDHHAVVDWRGGLGELFYQATRTTPMGIGRRRTIVIEKRRVNRISDDVFDERFKRPESLPKVEPPPIEVVVERPFVGELAVETDKPPRTKRVSWRTGRDGKKAGDRAGVDPTREVLSPSGSANRNGQDEADTAGIEIRAKDLLLEELARERTAEMSEVVATIQADQDRLIRAEMYRPLVIQGGPGTGKTIVGLHRAAYLLYELRGQVDDAPVLVLGPNPGFMEYIASVLPSLGESTVTQLSMEDLPSSHLTSREKSLVRIRATVSPAAARPLGDLRMVAALEAAIRRRLHSEALRLGFGRYVLRLDKAQVAETLGRLLDSSESYEAARRGLAGALADAFFDQYLLRNNRGGSHADQELESVLAATKELLAEEDLDKRLMPHVEARRLVMDLLGEPDLLESAGFDAVEAELIYQRPPAKAYPWAREHLPLLDEAARIVRGVPPRFAHVIVDEAQDLSPMQWRMVSRRVKRRSITILGDLAQGMSVWAPSSWKEVVEHIRGGEDATLGELRLGYRVPREIMRFASELREEAAPSLSSLVSPRSGPEPTVLHVGEDELAGASARAATEAKEGSIAIVAPEGLIAAIRSELDKSDSHRVSILTAEAARGREFDSVVVAEPAMIAADAVRPAQTLYVAVTRPTKTLTVVHSAELPSLLKRPNLPAGDDTIRPGFFRRAARALRRKR